MAWFRRNKTDQTVLPEIEKYYEAERKERAGLAWLLALVSVACVALILIGLFFGGKWAYNRLTDDKKDEPVAVQTTNESTSTDQTKDTAGKDNTNAAQEGTAQAPVPSTVPASSTPTAAVNPTTSKTPDSNLPGTGPEGLLALFGAVTIFSSVAHYALRRR